MNNPNQHGPIDWSDFLKQAMGGSPHTEKGTGFGGSGFDGGNADSVTLKNASLKWVNAHLSFWQFLLS